MKGDERVQTVEERADLALLFISSGIKVVSKKWQSEMKILL